MFRSLKSLIVIGLCLLAAPAFGAEAIRWQTNVFPAFQRAQAERKPLVIFFFGEGPDGMLTWSRKLAEGSFASTEVAACQEWAVFLKVNVDLEDAGGNVKRLKDGLNVKELPTVAVIDVGPFGWQSHGQMKGFFEHAEFTANLHSDLVTALIKIRRAAAPDATGEDFVRRVGEARNDVARVNEVLLGKGDEFQRQLKRLSQQGEFDGPAFERASAERNAAHLDLMQKVLDLAVLSPEAEEVGRVILTMGVAELGQCRQLEQDLRALTVGGRLPGAAAVERAQAVLRSANEVSAAEQKKAQAAIDKASEKFNSWLNKVAAT